MKPIAIITTVLVLLLAADNNNVVAQTKSGYFDIEYVINLMPGLSRVDTLLAVYQQDSLSQQYQELVNQLRVYDSLIMVRGDVTGFKSDKEEKAAYDSCTYLLQNWQQYSQQVLQAREQDLMEPFYKKVISALQIVLAEWKYDFIWKPRNPLLKISSQTVLIVAVIKKLGLRVPDDLLQKNKEMDKLPLTEH